MDRQAQFDVEYEIRTDGQVHLGPVNLDAMCEGDLLCAKDHPALHRDVCLYAHWKYEAMGRRVAGFLDAACDIEEKLERMYADLPHCVKW